MSNEGVELGSQGGVGNTSEVEGSIEERVNTLTNQVSVLTDLLTKLVTQGGGGAQVLGDSAPEVEARLGGSPREEGLPKSQYQGHQAAQGAAGGLRNGPQDSQEQGGPEL